MVFRLPELVVVLLVRAALVPWPVPSALGSPMRFAACDAGDPLQLWKYNTPDAGYVRNGDNTCETTFLCEAHWRALVCCMGCIEGEREGGRDGGGGKLRHCGELFGALGAPLPHPALFTQPRRDE